jgi:AcrR family transcriptional regulator
VGAAVGCGAGVFVAKGIDRATVKDIAQAAGVTPGLLYHYVDGKETLLTTLLEERSFLPKLRRQLAGATRSSGHGGTAGDDARLPSGAG